MPSPYPWPEDLDAVWKRRARSQVLRWYDRNGRTLPWRESADPYRIWISEIMLQQTTVAAVVPYFDRFLKRFPTVHALACAKQDEVLRQWEGLGYYSRARNLHKAAKVVVGDLNGQFPETPDELRQLPGIGPYTAGAIASFAFNQPAAIVEANTLRLFSRLTELRLDPRGTVGQKFLWEFSAWLVSPGRPADFNQAVMDIGSQVCTPVDPDCALCPLKTCCRAFAAGCQADVPVQKPKTEMTDVTEVSVAILRGNRFLLRQRKDDERWAGLWDFVRFPVGGRDVAGVNFPSKRGQSPTLPGQGRLFSDCDACTIPLPPTVRQTVAELTGLTIVDGTPVKEIHHVVTRYRIRLLCVVCDVDSGRILRGSGYKWCTPAELSTLPLSTTGRQFANLLLQDAP